MSRRLLDRGLNYLVSAMRGQSETVVYHSAATGAELEVPATLGQSEYAADDGQVVATEYTDADFLIAVGDLVLGGACYVPAAGDQIRRYHDGADLTYEVHAPEGQKPYRIVRDSLLRIHTKKIA